MLSPLALLWFLPIGGVITLLYLLKQKRRDVLVPSLLLWEQVLSPAASAAPFQRLRVDPLLLLQLLAALLLCLVLARPFVSGAAPGGKTNVLVIDASASMNATDVPGGRLQAAVGKAREIIAAHGASDTLAVVLAGTRPVVLAPLTDDKGRLLAALDRVVPGEGVNGPREALVLAGSLAGSRPDARVTLITDGVFARPDELSLGGARLSVVSVGRGGANVGITAFAVREQGSAGELQAFVTLENADAKPRTVPLTFLLGDAVVEAREVTIPASESQSLVVPLASADIPTGADFLTARIESPDDLAADNEAFAALPSREQIRVLLVSGSDDPFLERALTLAARVRVEHIAPDAFAAKDVAGHDLTVWDSDVVPPADLPPGRYLFFGAVPVGTVSPVLARGTDLESPPVLDWDRASPLLRFTDLSGVRVRDARGVTTAPWASVVVESKAAPLMVAGERGETRAVYVAFRPTKSDLPLRVAFPVFVANAVTYLAGHAEEGRVLHPGDPESLLPGSRVTAPGGSVSGKGGGDASGLTSIADRPGIYTVTGADGARSRFAVSLLSPAETRITPEPSPPITIIGAGSRVDDPAKPRQVPREWGLIFAVPLLVLLCAEWWLFYRRR